MKRDPGLALACVGQDGFVRNLPRRGGEAGWPPLHRTVSGPLLPMAWTKLMDVPDTNR